MSLCLVNPLVKFLCINTRQIIRHILFSFRKAWTINTMEVDFVVVAILVLVTLAHHQVAVRDWQAISEPVSL